MTKMKIPELFNLDDHVAVVTGGRGYLGCSISEGLAEAGATVYVASRNERKCKETAHKLRNQTNGKIKGIHLDIDDLSSVNYCFNKIVSETGQIDILVNNASFNSSGTLENISEKSWLNGINGTINGVFRTTKTVIPIMERNRSGSIINISSMYGIVSPDPSIYEDTGYDSPPNYGAGKAAIVQYSRYLACHLAKKGIRVNVVSPGPFPKPEIQRNRKFISRLEKKTPMGRIGKPEELKGVIVFLASKASSYVTGVNINVDGGWTAW